MGIENRDWYKEKQKENDAETLSNSSIWCKECQGLTVNALTLICKACGFDNSVLYKKQ
ncbi:hypothetical protein LCGC14_1751650 [marine sediment metagenome]|uniref:Uncharacterized protein n=1 Tax=marine sediment metagenome TaxID=412755 RepID=A0A0F9K336_9ZZZZ